MDPKTVTSLKLLSEGFKEQFVELIQTDERLVELFMTLSSEFVEENIPIVDEELQIELSLLLMESVKLSNF